VAACLISLVIGVAQHGLNGIIEGASIAFAILIIAFVTAINNYQKEK
jgi:hypothetical protein